MRIHPRAVLIPLNKLRAVLALQSVARVGMAMDYSQTALRHEALNQTFSG